MVNINREIRSTEVRLIDADGGQVGIVTLEEALRMAGEIGLDLVEVAPNSTPPVCRIMDYGKYKYQQAKKVKDAKKKQTVIQVKEVKLSPKTDEHDLEYKIAHVKRFLTEGNRAKVTIQFRGREIAYPEIARRVVATIMSNVEGIGAVEQEPRMEGRRMIFILRPLSAGKH
ncbi:MAG: translation initiation factor IF-3 [bacterium]